MCHIDTTGLGRRMRDMRPPPALDRRVEMDTVFRMVDFALHRMKLGVSENTLLLLVGTFVEHVSLAWPFAAFGEAWIRAV